MVQITVYLYGRIIPVFCFVVVVFLGRGGGEGQVTQLGFGLQHRELEKSMCFISYQNF